MHCLLFITECAAVGVDNDAGIAATGIGEQLSPLMVKLHKIYSLVFVCYLHYRLN